MLLFALAIILAACGPGQNGSDALAFVRDGALYRMQADGSGLFQIAPATVIGFAWSPDHHEVVARFSGATPNPTVTPFFPNPVADAPAAQGVVSIDGGNILPITLASPISTLSDAWWDANGNRLFYRIHHGSGVQWYLAQSDQPNGIARKLLGASAITNQAPNGEAWPTSAPDAGQVAWVRDNGDLVLGSPGGATRVLQSGVMTQLADGAPARPLWQPHQNAILYATGDPAQPSLMLTDLNGHARQILRAPLDGYSWSPDGSHVLIHGNGQWSIYATDGTLMMTWHDAAPGGIAWWSPDSKFVLVSAPGALSLATLAAKSAVTLATFTTTNTPVPLAAQALPITGSPWRGDGKQFALVSAGGTWSDHTALATHSGSGTGLYIISVNAATHAPKLVDWGQHQALSWSTPDPNTQWVVP